MSVYGVCIMWSWAERRWDYIVHLIHFGCLELEPTTAAAASYQTNECTLSACSLLKVSDGETTKKLTRRNGSVNEIYTTCTPQHTHLRSIKCNVIQCRKTLSSISLHARRLTGDDDDSARRHRIEAAMWMGNIWFVEKKRFFGCSTLQRNKVHKTASITFRHYIHQPRTTTTTEPIIIIAAIYSVRCGRFLCQ